MPPVIPFKRHIVKQLTVLVAAGALLLPAAAGAQSWHPGEPAPDGKDWVQLKSGEWVRGSIDLVRDLEMEFDSDDLDDLRIDWADIAAFRSPRMLTLVFTRDRVATGPSSMADGVIRVTTAQGIVEFPRADLLSIIEGSAREIDNWWAKATVGVTARSGNTEQSDFNSTVRIRREGAVSQLNLGYTGNFSEISGAETVNNHRGTVDLNYFLSRQFYVTPLSVEAYADEFQNIELRGTVGAGAGYYFYRTGDLEWSVGLGGAYRRTNYVSVEPGESDVAETGSLVPSTSLDADLTSDVELVADYSAQIGVPDAAQSTQHASLLLTIDLVGDVFELTASVTWDRVESPQRNADGVVPRRDDFRLAFGIGLDL